MSGRFAGTGVLLRHAARRDRWRVLLWSLALTFVYYSQAVGVDELYATQAELDVAARAMQANPALVAVAGPPRALDTVGGQVMWQSAAFGAVLAGVMSMFLVGRHTRAEEESGRDELVRAAPVGREAALTAAGLWSGAANLVAGLLVGGSLASYGLAPADSLATGLGLAVAGWCFTAVAMVAVQVTAGARSAYALCGASIGLAFVLRAVGDVASGWQSALSWLSPIGWYQAMHPFSGLRWWPAVLLLGATALGVVTAYALLARRDAGRGLLAARHGPAYAGRSLLAAPRLALGLAWRLQRGTVLGWTTGLLLGGLLMGSIGDGAAEMMGDSAYVREVFGAGGEVADGFYATVIAMLGPLAAGFAVASALRPRAEELAHAEVLLATALPRAGWLLGHTLVTVAGSALVLLAGGLGTGVGYALATGDAGATGRLTLATLAYLAPVLVLSGLARLAVGAVPRLAPLAWAGLVLATVVLLLGETLQLPALVQDLSPFHHLPRVPAEDLRAAPVLGLLAVAAALSAAGHLALRRRDVG